MLLIWQLADGRWVVVHGRAPVVPLDMLRRVADSFSLTPMPMTTSWGLRTVPPGYQVIGWNGGLNVTVAARLCRSADQLAADCLGVSVHEGTAPASTQQKSPGNPKTLIEVPVDQPATVNDVATRATADGQLVYAQIDAGHWASVYSQQAGVDLLREVATSVVIQ
jgi:hypothetical protein